MAPEEKDPANNPAEEPMFDFGAPASEGAPGDEMLFSFGEPAAPTGEVPAAGDEHSPLGFSPDMPAAAGLGGIPGEETPAEAGEEAADPKGKKKGKKGKTAKPVKEKVKKEKVQKVKKEKPKKPKKVGPPQFNSYTSMLCVALVALIVATGMMVMSLKEYEFKYVVPNEYKTGAKAPAKK